MREPELRDFGITPEDYSVYTHNMEWEYTWLVWLLAFIMLLAVVASTGFVRYQKSGNHTHLGTIRVLSRMFIASFVMWLVNSAVVRFKRSQIAPRIKLYEEAREAYQTYQIAQQEETERLLLIQQIKQQVQIRIRRETERVRRAEERALEEARQAETRARESARREVLRKREEYWSGLSGLEFERELGNLCERRGYEVSFTPVSGDGGADLILHKDGKTTVVQCKRHKSPASPAVVRELYGTMVHLGADRAILACTGGFTKGVRDFVGGKPIILVSALDLARMSEVIEGMEKLEAR